MATSTWRTTYTPGSWIVLNGPKALVAAQPTSADIAERLSATWNDVVAATDLESLVGKLMRWGMDVVPDLIVVFEADRLQCVVRGDITVTDVDNGEVIANGHGQAAWRSVNLDARHIAVSLPGQADSGTWRLPLAVGVVTAGSIDIDASDDVRVGVGDATFAVASLAGLPVVEPPAAAPVEAVESAVPEAVESAEPAEPAEPVVAAEPEPEVVEPEVAAEAEQPVDAQPVPDAVEVPADLQAPGAWATGFGDGMPMINTPVDVTDEFEAGAEAVPAADDAETSDAAEPEAAVDAESVVEPAAEAVAEAEAEVQAEPAAAVVVEPTDVTAELPAVQETDAQADSEVAVDAEPEVAVDAEPAADQTVAEADQTVAEAIPDDSLASEVAQADDGLDAQIEAAKAAVDQAIADSQVVPAPEPEVAVEPLAESAATVEAATEAVAVEPAPEPAVEPVPEPEPVVQVEPVPEAAAAEIVAEPEAAAQADLDKVDWQPASEPAPVPEPEPVPAPEPEPAPEAVAVPVPVPKPEPTPAPEPVAAPEPTPQPAPESVPEPTSEPEPEPAAGAAVTGSPLGATLLVFSDGQRWPVNEPLLVGRAPQAYPGETAHLVRVVSPHHDISRTHVRVELYDGAMWATDRESTNGTTVHNPGQAAATAQPGQPMHVWVGGMIDIGDGVTIRVQ